MISATGHGIFGTVVWVARCTCSCSLHVTYIPLHNMLTYTCIHLYLTKTLNEHEHKHAHIHSPGQRLCIVGVHLHHVHHGNNC